MKTADRAAEESAVEAAPDGEDFRQDRHRDLFGRFRAK
jgi:hypothetical protein